MSQLASLLESDRGAQRTMALRTLLSRPLLLSSDTPERFAMIVRHREWLRSWFADNLGWKLVVDVAAGFARLHKVPARNDKTRPARLQERPPFDRRRYTLLCLSLAALDDCPAQTTLVRLAKLVEELSVDEQGLVPFDPTSHLERRAFVDALRLLVSLGVLRLRDGDVERYTHGPEGDALYDISERLLNQLISAPMPPSFAQEPSRLLEEHLPDTEEGRRQRARHHVLRRLVEEPVVYFDELDAEAANWLEHSRGFIYRLLKDDVGLHVERRKEGLAPIDAAGELTDEQFPDGGSTVKHAALLLAEQLTSLHRRGTRQVERSALVQLMADLQSAYAEPCHWSRLYPVDADGAARLADDALELLEGFGLVARTPDGNWDIRAAVARFAPTPPSPVARRAPTS